MCIFVLLQKVVSFCGSYYYPIVQTRKMEVEWFKSPADGLRACDMQASFIQICTGNLTDEHETHRQGDTCAAEHALRGTTMVVHNQKKPQELSRAALGKGPL